MTLATAIAADILSARPVLDRSGCMSCGRAVDAVKASKEGGRHRFCSDRCLAYFDAGWDARRGPKWLLPSSDSQLARSYAKSASGRTLSEAAKQREKAKRKAAFAASWKKYLAKQSEERA